jgi:uncharacterized protein (DUF433 family)
VVNTLEERIASRPDVCGGAPCIADTRIRVVDIATYHELYGWSPETIVQELEGITLADVHTALAYYYTNIKEFRAAMKEEDELVEHFKKKLPSALKQKLLG